MKMNFIIQMLAILAPIEPIALVEERNETIRRKREFGLLKFLKVSLLKINNVILYPIKIKV